MISNILRHSTQVIQTRYLLEQLNINPSITNILRCVMLIKRKQEYFQNHLINFGSIISKFKLKSTHNYKSFRTYSKKMNLLVLQLMVTIRLLKLF